MIQIFEFLIYYPLYRSQGSLGGFVEKKMASSSNQEEGKTAGYLKLCSVLEKDGKFLSLK